MNDPPATALEQALARTADRAGNPFSAYLTHLSSDESRRTMRSCLIRVAALIAPACVPADSALAEAIPWHTIGYSQALAIRAKIEDQARKEGWSLPHVNKHLAAVRGVITQSWELGHIDADTMRRAAKALANVPGTRLPTGRHIEDNEVIRLLTATAEGGRPIDKRDAAIISAFHATGGRCSEVAAMRIEHYSRATRGTTFRGKGNKDREAYLHDDAARYMDEWLAALSAARGPVFRPIDQWGHIGERALTARSLGRIITRRRLAAGVNPLTTHDFRRTMVGDMLDRGVDLATVQQAAGHASPVTTAGYDRRRGRRIQEAVNTRNLAIHQAGPSHTGEGTESG